MPDFADRIVGLSAVLSNVSVGPPSVASHKLEEGADVLAGMQVGALATSKTFRNWQFLPWTLAATNGTNLFRLDNITVTFVKAPDPDTGVEKVFATIYFRQTSLGWRAGYGTNGPAIRVFPLNAAEGLLQEWVGWPNAVFACGENGEYKTARDVFRPDWYDLVEKVAIVLENTTWYSCG